MTSMEEIKARIDIITLRLHRLQSVELEYEKRELLEVIKQLELIFKASKRDIDGRE